MDPTGSCIWTLAPQLVVPEPLEGGSFLEEESNPWFDFKSYSPAWVLTPVLFQIFHHPYPSNFSREKLLKTKESNLCWPTPSFLV